MQLSNEEVKQFYRIWFPLLHFTNQKLNVVPSFPNEWGNASVSTDDARFIRDELWKDETNKILNDFIQLNPSTLNEKDLAIAGQWKHRISGSFYIFRYLKRYTVFLNEGTPDKAYGVLGLASTFEEMFGNAIPVYAQATILPFKDTIIYDSLISAYPISFGGGIKSSLKDTYRSIQEREGIIEMLPDSQEIDVKQVNKSNKKVLSAYEKYLGKSGVSLKKIIEHSENIVQFSDYLLTNFTPPIFLLDIDTKLISSYIQHSSQKVNLVSFKRFIRFLRESYRIYYDDAEDILEFLKHQ